MSGRNDPQMRLAFWKGMKASRRREENHALYSSPVWEAWEAGYWAKAQGLVDSHPPDRVCQGRGSIVRTSDHSYRIVYAKRGGGDVFSVERVAS